MEDKGGKQLHFWADCERIEPFKEQAEPEPQKEDENPKGNEEEHEDIASDEAQ